MESLRSGSRAMDMVMGRFNGDATPGWMCTPRVTYRIAAKPLARALHFKSHADRLKAEARLRKAQSSSKKMSVEEMDRMVAPFVNRVPVYRGALKCVMAVTLAADERALALAPAPAPAPFTKRPFGWSARPT